MASEHDLSLTTVIGEGNRTFRVVSNCCTPASKLVGGRRNVCAHLSHPLGGAEPCDRAQTDFSHATVPRSPSSRRRTDR
jgi:hypothetical protein